MTIIVALIVLSIVMLAHELGHFLAAKRVNIEVREFSLGFGPKLLGIGGPGSRFDRRKNDGSQEMVPTEYAIRIIPFGASVRMTGEEIGDTPTPYSFISKTPAQKTLVAFSGPFLNFVLAVIIYIIAYTLIGVPQVVNEAVVGSVVSGMPAAEAGILPGDRITSINGQPVDNWAEMVALVSKSAPGSTLKLTLDRSGVEKTVTLKPEYNQDTKTSIIGITAKTVIVKQGLLKGIQLGFANTYYMTIEMFKALGMIFSGAVGLKDLAGPVGITKLIGDAAQSGLINLLGFTAFLSINLGIFNLLPIPALDGSRIIFAGLEAVRHRPIEPDRENLVHLIGFALLMLFLTIVTYNDIVRWVKGY